MIKLSDFKNTGILKTIKYEDGVPTISESVIKLNGEIIIYDITTEKSKDIAEKIDVNNLNDEQVKNKTLYELIKILTNVQVDINYEEFINMLENPRNELLVLIETVIDTFYNYGQKIDTLNNINEKDNKIKELNIIKQQEEIKQTKEIIKSEEEQKQEKIKILEEEWNKGQDYKRMKEILIKLKELDSTRYEYEKSWIDMKNNYKDNLYKKIKEHTETNELDKIKSIMEQIDYINNDSWF